MSSVHVRQKEDWNTVPSQGRWQLVGSRRRPPEVCREPVPDEAISQGLLLMDRDAAAADGSGRTGIVWMMLALGLLGISQAAVGCWRVALVELRRD